MSSRIPPAEFPGLIPTLNHMGYMTESLNRYTQAFVEFSAIAPGPVLDVGAAYGNVALAALRAGARVIANDLDARHLEVIQERTANEMKPRLRLEAGRFPAGLDHAPKSLGAILLANVLHFFLPSEIAPALKACFRWLAPQGKLFIVAQSPHVGDAQGFLSFYRKKKSEGADWPGWVDDVSQFCPQRSPRAFHFLDPEVVSREVGRVGFQIERSELFSRPDLPPPFRGDGSESVGVIATRSK
jgi:SAM-dependent methyltransferase